MQLPVALEAMQDDRDQLSLIVGKLEGPLEEEARADLAAELVRYGARYEDVKERAVFPLLAAHLDGADLERAESDGAAVRQALSEVRRRIRHVKAINAHADDPAGFDEALDALTTSVRAELEHEGVDLFPQIEALEARPRAELKEAVEHAAATASEHPDPPKNRVARAIVNVGERVERVVHNSATVSHAGQDHLRHQGDAGGAG